MAEEVTDQDVDEELVSQNVKTSITLICLLLGAALCLTLLACIFIKDQKSQREDDLLNEEQEDLGMS